VIGFLATIARKKLASHELDASTEASGPHVFAVRFRAVRRQHVHVHVHRSPSHVRDDGRRPSCRDGMAIDMPLFALLEKRNIFYLGLDTISANPK
jgi:hypothetical protein